MKTIDDFVTSKTQEVLSGPAPGRDLQLETLASMRDISKTLDELGISKVPDILGLGTLRWNDSCTVSVKGGTLSVITYPDGGGVEECPTKKQLEAALASVFGV